MKASVWSGLIRAFKKHDYTRLSHHMLRAESAIVIHRAVRRCAQEGIWAVTIHDSIVTFPEHAKAVTAIMEEAFSSAGVRPHDQGHALRRGGPGDPLRRSAEETGGEGHLGWGRRRANRSSSGEAVFRCPQPVPDTATWATRLSWTEAITGRIGHQRAPSLGSRDRADRMFLAASSAGPGPT